MSRTHRIAVRVPMQIYSRFKAIFPYKGEMTAFVVRKMEEAIIQSMSEEGAQHGQTQNSNRTSSLGADSRGPHQLDPHSRANANQQGTHDASCEPTVCSEPEYEDWDPEDWDPKEPEEEDF